ncbi:MAG TPA: periplasmic heavy metal sensor [Terriglobales bacterium]|jgi:periplasmic protein CpxP/Spy|nr:periplasmic heavy metal sensor [Terriglobales bacterium]
MSINRIAFLTCVLFVPSLFAQNTAVAPPVPPTPGHPVHGEAGKRFFIHTMGGPGGGKWWQNSDTAKKLQLTDNQISQLDQIFYEHKMKLIDYGADMEKQDLKLQSLLDADVPDEGQVSSQVDQTLAARGKLEREFTMMNLDLRRVLSPEQWRQLKAIRGSGMGDNFMYFQKKIGPGGQSSKPVVMPLPPMALEDGPPPPPPPDDVF